MEKYNIWWKNHGGVWSQSTHIIKARSDKDAQSKMRRKFSKSGFTSMSIVAIVEGKTPTEK